MSRFPKIVRLLAVTFALSLTAVSFEVGATVSPVYAAVPSPSLAIHTSATAALSAPWTITWTGSQKVGGTLKVTPKGWYSSNGVTVKYQWKRGGTYIPGATSSGYKVQLADAGQTITVKMTGLKSGFSSKTVYYTFTIKPLDVLSDPWAIAWVGSQKVGSTVTVTPKGWYSSNGISVSYQWKRGSSYISGATSSSYKFTSADVGQTITVKIVGSKSGYQSKTVYASFYPKAVISGGSTVSYANCDAVRAAGKAPLLIGQPGYSSKLDRDNDGIACE